MNNYTRTAILTVPLTFEAHSLAQKYSKKHHQPKKAKQVYLNTLAVYAVNSYFQDMKFETDWENSDSRNTLIQAFMDVADLNVKHLGKVECRPILPGSEVLEVPSEALDNRIAYVGVQLEQSLQQATLLGFVTQLPQLTIPLCDLRSLAEFPEYLRQKRPVHLENWLDNIFEAGWQTLEEVFSNKKSSLAYAFRGTRNNSNDPNNLKRLVAQLYASQPNLSRSQIELEPSAALCQLIQSTEDDLVLWKAAELLWQINPDHPSAGKRRVMDLGMHLGVYPIALMVATLAKPDDSKAILLRLYPTGDNYYLPANLKLIGLDEAGVKFFEVKSREQDNYIQFIFSASLVVRFSISVAFADANVTEYFVV